MPPVRHHVERSVVVDAKFGYRSAKADRRRRERLDASDHFVERIDFLLGGLPKPKSEIATAFERCAEDVRRTVRFASSLEVVAHSDAYQQIVGMGPTVLPYVLRELRASRSVAWFRALNLITRQDAAAGLDTVEGAVRAWLSWGARHGYIDSDAA